MGWVLRLAEPAGIAARQITGIPSVATVAVFDFFSHGQMHLPFNEAYVRTLRAAFPDDTVLFCAKHEQVTALAPLLANDPAIRFQPISGFAAPFGLSRHNPLGGWLAAKACISTIAAQVAGKSLRMAAVLGADANLHAALRSGWRSVSTALLHVIVHNHVAAGVQWRSRNPILRRFDMLSRLQPKLPATMRLVALELGIAEAIGLIAPALRGAVDTLEHPILESEWGVPSSTAGEGPLRIGFLGHASRDKGFHRFAAWAKQSAGPERSFHAVGLASADALRMDLSGLATPPSPTSVARPDYVALLAACDLVCLPLSPIYDYVASGSVIDAIAGLKPLYSVRNRSLLEIRTKYGAFGELAQDEDALGTLIRGATRADFAPRAQRWIAVLTAIRAARTPAALAPGYRSLIAR